MDECKEFKAKGRESIYVKYDNKGSVGTECLESLCPQGLGSSDLSLGALALI
jgi:hypothetical protein